MASGGDVDDRVTGFVRLDADDTRAIFGNSGAEEFNPLGLA
jgi:hypothetical protein